MLLGVCVNSLSLLPLVMLICWFCCLSAQPMWEHTVSNITFLKHVKWTLCVMNSWLTLLFGVFSSVPEEANLTGRLESKSSAWLKRGGFVQTVSLFEAERPGRNLFLLIGFLQTVVIEKALSKSGMRWALGRLVATLKQLDASAEQERSWSVCFWSCQLNSAQILIYVGLNVQIYPSPFIQIFLLFGALLTIVVICMLISMDATTCVTDCIYQILYLCSTL